MNKKFTLLTIVGTMAVAGVAAIAFGSKNVLGVNAGDECANGAHVGNHYVAKDPTCVEAGNSEFWACCECHHQYLEQPANGAWTDCGEYVGTLESTHVAYVAPTGIHEYGYNVVDSATTPGNIDIVKSCNMCGELLDDTVYNTMVKKAAAGFNVDLTERTNPWIKTGENEYTSMSGLDGSTTYMTIIFTSSGSFSFEYDVSSESGWDKFYVGTTASGGDVLNGISGTQKGSQTVDVTEGSKLYFRYAKDSGGKAGRDNVIVNFVSSDFVYDVVEYVVNGGVAVAPGFIENGVIVGELPTTTKDNAYFEGWCVDAACNTKYEGEKLSGYTKLYAEWSDPCVVTLNYNYEGSVNASLYYQKGTTTNVAAEVPSREGFYFLGWYQEAACTNAYVDGTINGNIEVFAKWIAEADAHELYGDYKGFKAYNSSWSGYSISDSYPELSVGVDGSIKLRTGWSTYVDDVITAYDASTGAVTTQSGRFAYYDATDEIFVICESVTMTSSSYIYVLKRGASAISKMNAVAKALNSAKIVFIEFLAGTEKRNLYISVDENKVYYGVSFSDVDGNSLSLASFSSTANMVQIVVRQGATEIATFGGKSSNEISTTVDKYFGNYTASDESTLRIGAAGYAIFSKASSSSFVTYTEVSDGVIYIKYSSSISMNLTLDVTNKTFTYADRTVTVTLNENYEGGTTYTETWIYDIYTSIEHDDPVRSGYVFDGWYTEATGGSKITGTKALKEDTTFYAHWLEALTVTCVLNNGEDNVVVPVASGQVGSYPTPTKAGQYFVGWYANEALTEEFDVKTPITSSITIYAKYADPVAFRGHYTGFNLCSDNAGFAAPSPSTTYRGAIGDNGVGTKDKFTDWKFVDDGNGRYSCTKGTSKAVASYSVAADGTYFICTHYSGPNSDAVPSDNLFGINTGESYQNDKVSFRTLKLNSRIWLVDVTYDSKTYTVFCDSTHDVFEADVQVKVGGTAVTLDDIYNGGLVAEFTIEKAGKVVANCSGPAGASTTTVVIPAPELSGTWELSDGTHTGTMELTVEHLNNVTSTSNQIGTFTVDETVYKLYWAARDGKEYTLEIYEGGSAYIYITIDDDGNIVSASFEDAGNLMIFGYGIEDMYFDFTTFTKK